MFAKLTITHKINIVLYAVAFGLFVVNQFAALSGWVLDLRGPAGAGVLTAFLACGALIQLAKLFEGHDRWYEWGLTMLLLGAHVYAEITIWERTQIQQIGLAANLPVYIVGLYWVVGVGDILVMTWRHNIQRLRGEYKSRADLERELALAEQRSGTQSGAHASLVRGKCDVCGAKFERTTALGVQNAINAHARWCPGPQAAPSPNGHKQPEQEKA